MSLKILFTHSFFLRLDSKQLETAKPYPPLGTLYAMSWLRELGHEVQLHDATFTAGPEAIREPLERLRPDLVVLWDDNFNWLTKMCLAAMQRAAFETMRLAAEAGARVVVSSSDASDHRQRYLERGAAAVLLGEGELSLGEVAAAIERGSGFETVAGLALLVDGAVRETSRRDAIREPDQLPRPAWDLIDLSAYEEMWRQRHGYWSLNLVSSRGCPYKCSWCAKPLYGNQYYLHSPERVVADLAWLKSRYNFEHVWFCDDIFGLRADWLERFAAGLAAAGITIRSMIQARADLLVREQIREPLVRSGLETVWLGAESGSQKVLDAMRKGITVEDVHVATKALKAAGVRVGFFLQFGYLGETREDIDETLEMLLTLLPDEIGVSVSYPLPGTEFHQQVQAQMGGKTNWESSDDLALMYRGTFSPAYYRRLHRYVHKRFQAARGWASLMALVRRPWQADRRLVRSAILTGYFAPASVVDHLRLRRLEVAV